MFDPIAWSRTDLLEADGEEALRKETAEKSSEFVKKGAEARGKP